MFEKATIHPNQIKKIDRQHENAKLVVFLGVFR
jgi:hypothetical protein